MREYYPFSDEAYLREALEVQRRVDRSKAGGVPVGSEQVWTWIKERTPGWQELDWHKVFQMVKR